MIALIQRVTSASVVVDGETTGEINQGLLAFIGVEKTDDASRVAQMLTRLLGYRVFSDQDGKMNLSVRDIHGGLLLVPQFTLAADTRKGMRPSFSSAAPPQTSAELFAKLVALAREDYDVVETGVFGADMQVHLVNNGPVTFWLQV